MGRPKHAFGDLMITFNANPIQMTDHLAYDVIGAEAGEWLTLSHPIGCDRRTWDPIMEQLAERYRVLSVDTRGHGQSAVRGAQCDVDDLASDLLALWAHLGIERSHLVGVSLGGCVGLAVAHQRPASVQRLVIAAARLEMDEAATDMWRQRAATAMKQGMEPLLDGTLDRWLTPDFRAAMPERAEAVRQTLKSTSPQGFAACAHALADMHQLGRLAALRVPALLISGRADTAVPGALVQGYAAACPQLQHIEIDGPHLLHQENPEGFQRAVLAFLAAR